jgi:hypothetical protein
MIQNPVERRKYVNINDSVDDLYTIDRETYNKLMKYTKHDLIFIIDTLIVITKLTQEINEML